MVLVCMLALRTQNLEKKLQEIELRLVPTVEMWARLGANLRPCLELVCTLWLRYLLRFLRRSRKTCHDCLWMPRSVKASAVLILWTERKAWRFLKIFRHSSCDEQKNILFQGPQIPNSSNYTAALSYFLASRSAHCETRPLVPALSVGFSLRPQGDVI